MNGWVMFSLYGAILFTSPFCLSYKGRDTTTPAREVNRKRDPKRIEIKNPPASAEQGFHGQNHEKRGHLRTRINLAKCNGSLR